MVQWLHHLRWRWSRSVVLSWTLTFSNMFSSEGRSHSSVPALAPISCILYDSVDWLSGIIPPSTQYGRRYKVKTTSFWRNYVKMTMPYIIMTSLLRNVSVGMLILYALNCFDETKYIDLPLGRIWIIYYHGMHFTNDFLLTLPIGKQTRSLSLMLPLKNILPAQGIPLEIWCLINDDTVETLYSTIYYS